MSYRCSICNAVSQPGKPRLVHHILRPDGNIARELAVCPACHRLLAEGVTLGSVRKHAQAREVVSALPAKAAPQTQPTAITTGTTFLGGDEL